MAVVASESFPSGFYSLLGNHRHIYILKSLNMSSKDFFRAASRLFSIILKISASSADYFFFFFLFSSSLLDFCTLII